jgi:hypothetical protein
MFMGTRRAVERKGSLIARYSVARRAPSEKAGKTKQHYGCQGEQCQKRGRSSVAIGKVSQLVIGQSMLPPIFISRLQPNELFFADSLFVFFSAMTELYGPECRFVPFAYLRLRYSTQ